MILFGQSQKTRICSSTNSFSDSNIFIKCLKPWIWRTSSFALAVKRRRINIGLMFAFLFFFGNCHSLSDFSLTRSAHRQARAPPIHFAYSKRACRHAEATAPATASRLCCSWLLLFSSIVSAVGLPRRQLRRIAEDHRVACADAALQAALNRGPLTRSNRGPRARPRRRESPAAAATPVAAASARPPQQRRRPRRKLTLATAAGAAFASARRCRCRCRAGGQQTRCARAPPISLVHAAKRPRRQFSSLKARAAKRRKRLLTGGRKGERALRGGRATGAGASAGGAGVGGRRATRARARIETIFGDHFQNPQA